MSNKSDTPENKAVASTASSAKPATDTSKTAATKTVATDTKTPHKPADKQAHSGNNDKHKSKDKTATKPHVADKKAGGGFTSLIAWLALLLVAALAAGAWYGWQLYQQQQTTLALAQASLSQSLDQQLSQLQAQQQQQAEQLKQQQDALMTSINEVHSRLGNTTRDWMLSEAHYLLQLGNQQAQLAANTATAIVAFELADKRLQAVGEPALLPVRKQIAHELESLKAINEADIDGIVLKLGELAQQSSALLMLTSTLPQSGADLSAAGKLDTEAMQQGWESMLQAIWKALKSLVTVRYHEQDAQPLLTPDHAQAIRDSLELKLNQARLAALQKNTAVFQDSVKHSADWLQRYFSSSDKLTANMLQTLQAWQTVELAPAVPDISKSRRMLIDTASRLKMLIQNPPADSKTPATGTSKNTAS